MRSEVHDRGLVRRLALVAVLAVASTPGWCPEAPLLQTIDEARLRPNLEASQVEVAQLVARQRTRQGAGDLDAIASAVGEAARRNNLPPELVLAVIRAESSFRPDAISQKGAVGLMQLMPYTARALAPELSLDWTTDGEMLRDPHANIALGSLYLGKLLASFDDLDHSLAAYNRGPTAVRDAGWPRTAGETAGFIRRVKGYLAKEGALGSPRSFGVPHESRSPGVNGL